MLLGRAHQRRRRSGPTPGLPSCTIGASITVEFPYQEPVTFSGSLELLLKSANLSGVMDGSIKSLFGVYGLNTGGWVLGSTVDYASLVGLTSMVPLSDFSMAFDLELAGKKVHMAGKIGRPSINGLGDLAFEGKFEGGLSLGDCLDFAGGVVEETPHVNGTAKDLREQTDGFMPSFMLGDVRVFFSPKDVEIGGVEYSRGIIIDGEARLFGSDAQLFVDVGTNGIKVVGYIQEMKFGPLTITGPGYDRIMDTTDDGLILDAELTLDQQYCYMGGVIEVDILGGLSAETTINVSREGFSFHTQKKLFDLFDCGLTFRSHFNEKGIPVDFYVNGYMHQSALSALQDILSNTARSMAIKKMSTAKLE